MSIADKLGTVTRRIQKATSTAGRVTGSVQLLAVSKTRGPEDIRAAAASGQIAFGENYLQEALQKIQALQDLPDLEWHFIGPIQSNKTRDIAENFQWVHSVDREKIARRLSEQRPTDEPPMNICIQVNIDNEPSKSGVPLADLDTLAATIADLPGLRLRGLMAIPDPNQPEAVLQDSFQRLATHLHGLQTNLHGQQPGATESIPLDTLSMGMSSDLELAVQAGATMVRVGTAVFGLRER